MKVLLTVIEIGAVTVSLEIIAGGLISLFLHRRRLLSLLDQVYEAMKDRPQNMALCIGSALRGGVMIATVLMLCGSVWQLEDDSSYELLKGGGTSTLVSSALSSGLRGS